MSDDPFEHVAFLSRSKTRVCLLALLSDRGPTSRRTLRDRLEASQSTVVRSVQALERRGWVEREDGAVRATGAGTLVADEFRDLLDGLNETTDLRPFLQWFPHEEFDLDLTHLYGATLTTPSPGDPYAPAREQTELVRTASRVRVLLPSIDIEGTRAVHERITNGDLAAEVVVGPDVCETIYDGEYARLFGEQIDAGLSVFGRDEAVPFYLGLDGEGVVQIGVEDDDGVPQALLETDCEPVRDWADDVYRSCRDRATELAPEDFA